MRTEHGEPLCVRALTPAEIEGLIALAHRVWHAHYPGIISVAQIEYMLDQRYRPEVIRSELERSDTWWELALMGELPVGFSSCVLTAEPGEMKLDKLYVHPQYQGAGVGGKLLQSVRARARALQCGRLVLAVNKRNAGAIAAYQRWGFRIEQSKETDIGGGFVMDDYIMVVEP
jgi:ribosomal protein S18 acetylase RimI-like enzyme